MKAEHKAYLALIVAMLCWSTSGIAIKQALLVFTPLTLIVCRFTLSVSLMFLIGKLAGIFAKNATQPENLENNPAGFGATSDNSLSGFQEASGEAYHTNPAGFGANPDNIGEAYHTSPDSLAGPNQPFISTSSGETPTSQPSATPNNPEAAYQTPSENPAKASNPLAFFALTPLAKHDIPLFLIAGFLQPFLYYLDAPRLPPRRDLRLPTPLVSYHRRSPPEHQSAPIAHLRLHRYTRTPQSPDPHRHPRLHTRYAPHHLAVHRLLLAGQPVGYLARFRRRHRGNFLHHLPQEDSRTLQLPLHRLLRATIRLALLPHHVAPTRRHSPSPSPHPSQPTSPPQGLRYGYLLSRLLIHHRLRTLLLRRTHCRSQ